MATTITKRPVYQIQRKNELWVTVGIVKELTIFDNREKLRNARQNGLIQMKREGGGIRYNLNSVNEKFLVKKEVA